MPALDWSTDAERQLPAEEIPEAQDASTPPPLPQRRLLRDGKLAGRHFVRGLQITALRLRQRFGRAARRAFSPARVAMMLMALLVTGTIAWRWDAYRQQQLGAELAFELDAGLTALESGELTDATGHLIAAGRAARRLRGDTDLQLRAEQYAREATAWKRLAVLPIETVLESTDTDADEAAELVRQQFAEHFAGGFLIFEAHITRRARSHQPEGAAGQAEPGGASQARLQAEWIAVGPAGAMVLELPDVRTFQEVQAGRSRRVLFGARLDRLVQDPIDERLWHLTLEPESCVLITLPAPLQHVGWPDVEAANALVMDQAALWEDRQ